MQLCAITDRRAATQPLVRLVEGWSAGGVHFIQLREKDLSADALESLAREIMGKIDRSRSKLLVNVSTPSQPHWRWRPAWTEFILPASLGLV